MTTYYADLTNGNDANDGTTFANRKKTLQAGINLLANGDTLRVMQTPAPTSLGTGAWTNGPLRTRVTTSFTSTNATPINIAATAHGLVTGDFVNIDSHSTNTKANGWWKVTRVDDDNFTLDGSVGNGAGSGGGWRKVNNVVVELTTAPVKLIAACDVGYEANWTASANVTCTQGTIDFRSGWGSQTIAINTSFTTGKAAYFALGAATDFSGYQQVTFWIKQTAGTSSMSVDGEISLRLCSDTTGDTTVNTIAIPGLQASNNWHAVTVDLGAALGASIQSVAFYVDSDPSGALAKTWIIDAIHAVKAASDAASLNFNSMIGKNVAGETFYHISSIEKEKFLILDNDISTGAWGTGCPRGYTGTTESVTTYKLEPFRAPWISSTGGSLATGPSNGTASSFKTISGGWDTTDMTTVTGYTWITGGNNQGRGVDGLGQYNSYDRICFSRYGQPIFNIVKGAKITNLALNNNAAVALSPPNTGATEVQIDNLVLNNNGTNGASLNSGAPLGSVGTLVANNNRTYGAQLGPGVSNIFIKDMTAKNNGTTAEVLISDGSVVTFGSLVAVGGVANAISTGASQVTVLGGSSSGHTQTVLGVKNFDVKFKNFTFGDTGILGAGSYNSGSLYSHNHGGVSGDHRIFTCDNTGDIRSESSVRHTASGLAWKFSPTSANRDSGYPLRLLIARVACTASALVTIKAWLRRTNTGLTMQIMTPGGFLSGVSSNVVTAMTAAADTWEQVTLTFTPTEAGVADIFAEAYGGTTYSGYIDDLTISQA